jgi:DNA-binding IclR family transcriptional regulator
LEELVKGEASCAAPIRDRRGASVGAIAVSGPVERVCDRGQPRAELVSYVREGARTISKDLGAIPW